MSWLSIDDGFAENAKVSNLADRSFRLHVVALCYCARNLTDGILDDRAVRVCSAIVSSASVKRHIRELVDAGLWVEIEGEDGCFAIKDYLVYNLSADEVKERRAKRSEAGRIGGRKSGQSRRRARRGEANDEASAEASASRSGSKQTTKRRGSTPSPPIGVTSTCAVDAARAPDEQHGLSSISQEIDRSLRLVKP